LQFAAKTGKLSGDMLVLLVISTGLSLLTIKLDLFTRVISLMLPAAIQDHGALDEYLTVILMPPLLYAALACRRYQELERECARRKVAEEAVREREELFRLVFDQSTEGIVLAEPASGKILYVNETLTELLGYSREELFERGTPLLYSHFCAENLELTFAECAAARDFLSSRIRTQGSNGTELTVSLRVKSVKIGGCDLVHLTLRDMTEKVRQEDETKTAQAKLIHANKMSSLGLLVSGVAHEINNPNNFIMFNSSMLSEIWQDTDRILDDYYRSKGVFALGGLPYPEIGEATRKLIDGICEGAQRIKVTVDNLKDFARQDVPGLDRPLDLNRAVLKSVSILAPQIKKHCDRFTLHLDERLPEICGNAQKIEQVVMNLLLNALQSLPDRECAVSVSTSFSRDGRTLVATIEDQGIGMDHQTMKRLSEPFFTTKRDNAGTGLGLYISKSIIKEHGGALLFESEPGKGTSARIELPQHQSEEPDENAENGGTARPARR
jgi:PAS domain S-box-containing protein